jgi:hypothetical protein
MIVNHHQTHEAFTKLTVQPNGMFKVVHKSPTAFKFQIKKDFYEALNLFNRMVNFSIGKREFTEPATPVHSFLNCKKLKSFTHYANR